jgi:hypothetical protein
MTDFSPLPIVITGFVPVIHAFSACAGSVDGRVKPGQDDNVNHMFVSER